MPDTAHTQQNATVAAQGADSPCFHAAPLSHEEAARLAVNYGWLARLPNANPVAVDQAVQALYAALRPLAEQADIRAYERWKAFDTRPPR